MATLRNRQNDEGAFGLWAANPRVDPLASVYALHILTEAKERGWTVPGDALKSGLGWLQTLARQDGDSLPEERIRAYAIYVLTRNGMVTSGFAQALQKHLEANYPKEWRADLAAAYLAASYQLLRQDKLARSLIDDQKLGQARVANFRYYDDALSHDAQLNIYGQRHFPDRAAKVTPEELDAMVQPIFQGLYNTFSSAHTIFALEAYGEAAQKADGGAQAIRELLNGQKRALALPAGMLPLAPFDPKASALEFSTEGAFEGVGAGAARLRSRSAEEGDRGEGRGVPRISERQGPGGRQSGPRRRAAGAREAARAERRYRPIGDSRPLAGRFSKWWCSRRPSTKTATTAPTTMTRRRVARTAMAKVKARATA